MPRIERYINNINANANVIAPRLKLSTRIITKKIVNCSRIRILRG